MHTHTHSDRNKHTHAHTLTLVAEESTPALITVALPIRLDSARAVLAPRVGDAHIAVLALPSQAAPAITRGETLQ